MKLNLKACTYLEMSREIRRQDKPVIVYGAGMIGQIVVSYIIGKYQLYDYISCYVDMDKRKIGRKVAIGFREYEIRTPEILKTQGTNIVILLTNSKFKPVLEYLERMESDAEADCYIIPAMQLLEQRRMIPKVIHYCWFGKGQLPDFLKECIASWKKYCPEYEIVRWDEGNYDVSRFEYTRQAYEAGQFGFVTDLARLDILYENGGIYLDTDVMLLKSMDSLLYNKGFVGVEKWGNINSGGGIGAIAHHPMIREMLDYRLRFSFIFKDGSQNLETNGFYETVPFIRHGMKIDNTLQIINEMTVYPSDVFHPYNYMSKENDIGENTISIHYFFGGWMDEKDKNNRENTQENYFNIMKRVGREK